MRDADDTTTANLPPDLRAIALQRRLTRRFDDLVASTEDLREKLRAWLMERGMRRSVFVVDDSPPALCALVSVLSRMGVVVHAVTTDASAESTLRGLGAEVHVVGDYARAASVWQEVRSCVVVVDLHLGDGLTGLDVLADIGRGPRALVVTSCDSARDSIDRVADTVQADAVVRTHTGGWETRLRDGVNRLLDEASSGGDA